MTTACFLFMFMGYVPLPHCDMCSVLLQTVSFSNYLDSTCYLQMQCRYHLSQALML
uniref:Uncharacterized protein n=1 Tax=Anguilla anguilla TaxID=7936 RepID=A0A0E9UK31_ANGAN